MNHDDLLLRLVLAAAAGMALGLERQRGGHAAGARTHLLVAVGACMFTLSGAYGFDDVGRSTVWDPGRIAAQVASGIGFIGAGAILRDGATTKGITTAATLWISAVVGVGMGAGCSSPPPSRSSSSSSPSSPWRQRTTGVTGPPSVGRSGNR